MLQSHRISFAVVRFAPDIETAHLPETYRSDHWLTAHDAFFIAVPSKYLDEMRKAFLRYIEERDAWKPEKQQRT